MSNKSSQEKYASVLEKMDDESVGTLDQVCSVKFLPIHFLKTDFGVLVWV